MRRWTLSALSALIAVLILLPGALAEGEAEPAEWTVMFYMCGSDLESKHGYATDALESIIACEVIYTLDSVRPYFGLGSTGENIVAAERVDVVVETGGSSKWQPSDYPDIEIDPGKLQRWSFTNHFYAPSSGFALEQELPSANMADPRTLSDFIQWSVQTHPARKYALVLWDHGGGSKTGLFVDELYDHDVMYLDELKTALADGGAQFETVIFDACLMANLETACAVKDNARWMVASEEIVPGQGTCVRAWLQELYNNPACDGRQLGRSVCDMTQRSYANTGNDQANSILTWSLIDLSKIDRVAADFDSLFAALGQAYTEYNLMATYASMLTRSEEYGGGSDQMIDLAGVIYCGQAETMIPEETRGEMLEALSDAVVYCVRGPGRSGALGLSFCYAASFDIEELSVYARNCPSPHYLAFLDALSDWTAPDSVYQTAPRLPGIDEIKGYTLKVEKLVVDGIPAICFSEDSMYCDSVFYTLYRMDDEMEQVVSLGEEACVFDFAEDGRAVWHPFQLSTWPAIEGSPCCMQLIDESEAIFLYSIPIQISNDVWYLRCGLEFGVNPFQQMVERGEITDTGVYRVYGLWEGYDSDSAMPSRNVKSLSQMAGQEFRLLYPTQSGKGRTSYGFTDMMTMYRSLELEKVALPAGTYYLEYVINDIFERPVKLEQVELHWDGESFSMPREDEWQGKQTLRVKRG